MTFVITPLFLHLQKKINSTGKTQPIISLGKWRVYLIEPSSVTKKFSKLRRNLTPALRIKLALRKEPIIAKQAKERQLAAQNNKRALEIRENLQAVPDKCLELATDKDNASVEDKCPQLPKTKNQTRRENETNYQVAQIAQVSDKTVQRYKKIQEKASDEVKAKVDSGEISINEGYNQVKRAEKETKQEERAERKSYTPPTELPQDDFKLICADIRDGLPDIEDNSIDFIITDPPYPKEYLPLYEDLSKVAARVLKDGGSLVCMAGQSYLPDVIQLLATNLPAAGIGALFWLSGAIRAYLSVLRPTRAETRSQLSVNRRLNEMPFPRRKERFFADYSDAFFCLRNSAIFF